MYRTGHSEEMARSKISAIPDPKSKNVVVSSVKMLYFKIARAISATNRSPSGAISRRVIDVATTGIVATERISNVSKSIARKNNW